MRIGVMLRNMGEKGGIVVYATNLLNALLEIDTQNQYFLMYRYAADAGRFAHVPNVVEKVIPAQNKLWWDQVAVPRFARKEGLDLIYNPKLSIPLVTRCKTVWVMHGGAQFVVPHVFKWHDRIYFTTANRLYAKKANAVITMTHLGAKDIVKYMGVAPKKIHVIYESYNECCSILEKEKTLAVKERYNLPENFILFVGGLSPLKNFGNIVRAYHKIQNSIPHQLVVAGFNRWKFSKDLQLIDQLALEDKVLFKGFIPDEELPAFYNLADLFVFPSLYEGFGIPVLEAMACGCPVIASNAGCSPEVVADAGILVDPYDSVQIAEAIQLVLKDEMLRNQLIEKGLARTKQFSWQNCARETLALFSSV